MWQEISEMIKPIVCLKKKHKKMKKKNDTNKKTHTILKSLFCDSSFAT